MINFPKAGGMTHQMIEAEKQRKEVVFRDDPKRETPKRSAYEGFKINTVLKGAREVSDMPTVPSAQYFRPPKVPQLSPIMKN